MTKPILLWLVAAVLVLLPACSDGNDAATARLLADRDSLRSLAELNQQKLEEMTGFFNSVSECLDSITDQEKLLTGTVDMETNRRYSKAEIKRRLEQLSDIVNRQRQKISALSDSLAHSANLSQIVSLQQTIQFLNAQLQAKESQIKNLQKELADKNLNIARLNSNVSTLMEEVTNLSEQNDNLNKAVEVQTEVINECYVLIASKSQLENMGIVKGGFLRKTQYNPGNVNLNQCQKVDIRHFNNVPVNSKKPKIITPVPSSSYSFYGSGESKTLVISDPAAFWSLSNVLIIQL